MAKDDNKVLPRNRLTLADKANIAAVLLVAPIVIIWTALKTPFSAYGRAKGPVRLIADQATRHLTTHLNRRQLRALFGTTRKAYEDWARGAGIPTMIDELSEMGEGGEGARLLWIGPRSKERVILHFHGGAFLLACVPSSPALWWHMKNKFKQQGKDVGIAMLQYSLVPDKPFPAQLTQAILAIQHILASGIQPQNILLAGDSAGGLLIHEIFSHLLHPIPGVPKLEISAPFAGAYMMSPWTRLTDPDGTLLGPYDVGGDMIAAPCIDYWGRHILESINLPAGFGRDSLLPYLQANEAPEGWLKGIDRYVRRVLVTAGDIESLRGEIVKYGANLGKQLQDTTTLVQEHAIHMDPYVDFLVKSAEAPFTATIFGWMNESFSRSV